MTLREIAHIEFDIAIDGKQLFRMLQQPLPRRRKTDTRAIALEKLDLELLLQFLDVPGDGWLRDKQFFGRSGKIQAPGHGVKYL